MALGATPTASGGGDLFDGLSLDYNFLDTPRGETTNGGGTKENDLNTTNTGGAMMRMDGDNDDPYAFTPRVAHMMASLGGNGSSSEMLNANDHMLFDHDVASNGISGTPRSAAAAALLNPQQQQQDIPTPLSFSFSLSPVRGGGDAATTQQRYRTAPQHKHKRVRSNPDVIFSFQQTLHSGLDPVTESMPTTEISSNTVSSHTLRPSINTVVPTRGRTVSNELANAVISSILNDFQDPPPAVSADSGALPNTPPMAPIGPVQVMTPVGLNDVRTTPIPFNQLGDGMHNDDSFKDMDEFLQDLSWAEIPTDGGSSSMEGITSGTMSGLMRREDQERMIESSPVAYRSQRIQEGVNELKMKRKRPQHGRHHSNPVDLLHNIDQFRILAQQTKQQQQLQQLQQQDPSSVLNLNSFALPGSSGGIVDFQQGAAMQQQQQQFNQFQVPAQIASGAARSLHDRRSSLPNVAGFVVGVPTGNGAMPPRAAARRAQRSTGISMDMSQMNLSFLSVPEEEFQQQYQQFQQQQQQHQQTVNDSNSKKALALAAEEEANRKLYKCGRCGQPKVGHVCTMPDQRNNWTQVDLEVTKGLKVMRINCHILPVKSRWVTQDEENLRDELRANNVRMQ
ncbi:hypothetical protein Gpo141_00006790 [Globisporangium polare]